MTMKMFVYFVKTTKNGYNVGIEFRYHLVLVLFQRQIYTYNKKRVKLNNVRFYILSSHSGLKTLINLVTMYVFS